MKLLLYMTVFLVAINLSFWIFYFVTRKYLDDDLGKKLTGVSQFVASGIRGDYLNRLKPGDEKSRTYKNIRSRLEQAKLAFHLNSIVIVDAQKKLLVDADGRMAIGDPVYMLEAAGDEVDRALAGTSAASLVYRGEDGRLYKSGYAPVRDSKREVTDVLVAEASAAFLGELEIFRDLIVVITLISFFSVLVLGLFLSRFVATPILRLVHATRAIREGKYESLGSPGGNDEIGYLTRAFNEMAESIRQNEHKLRALYTAEAERAKEVERYAENILGSIATGIVSVDKNRVIKVCNAEACRVFGVQEDEISDRRFDSVQGLSPFWDALAASLGNGEVVKEKQMEYVNPSGEHFHLGFSCSPLKEAGETSIAANMVITDHTALVKLQEEIKRKETLAAVGELAAHVAHEVRNPLGSIKIYMDLLSRKNIGEAQASEFIEKISSEISRLDAIVSEFLQFSAPSRIACTEFFLVDVIKDAILFAHKEDDFDNVTIKENLGEYEKLLVSADKNQLMQMFLNLLLNSCEAMPGGGTINVKISVLEKISKHSTSAPAGNKGQNGQMVSVTIKDTGCGIEPEKVDKIFAPFFTTKSRGTGLGLAIVQRVLENHNGRIEVDSSPDKGTSVTLLLPVLK